jgi:N-acetylneuraminic acid mutarotase
MDVRVLRTAVAVAVFTAAVASEALAINHNTWSEGAPMPVALQSASAGTIGSKIYVAGGATSNGGISQLLLIYNPATNSWSAGQNLPIPVAAGEETAVVGSTLYVIGGVTSVSPFTVTSAVQAYNSVRNSWTTTLPNIPSVSSFGGSAAAYRGNIYVVGGGQACCILTTVESYSISKKTWSQVSSLLDGTADPSVGTIGSAIVAAGGFTASASEAGDTEAYNPSTNTWTPLATQPVATAASCTGVVNKLLYALGGAAPFGNPLPQGDTTQIFNLKANSWSSGTAMPVAVRSAAGAVYRGKIYCFGGGETESDSAQNIVQIYQP